MPPESRFKPAINRLATPVAENADRGSYDFSVRPAGLLVTGF